MIDDRILVNNFEPVCLTIEDVGPFRGRPAVFDFTDEEGNPCNFYLLAAKNGRGKTTVLELFAILMDMLGRHEMESFGHEGLDRHRGRAQLDLLVRLFWEGKSESLILSLLAGSIGEESALRVWLDDDLSRLGAKSWHRFGFRRRSTGALERIGRGDDLVEDLNSSIKTYVGQPPQGFEDNPLTFPTVLYFSAYRDIIPVHDKRRTIEEPDWGYKPVHRFGKEGEDWIDSLDNLLVWLRWLDDGRFDRVISVVNERVFDSTTKFLKGIRKQPPEAIMISDNSEHRLDQLSSGEKSLLQLFVRIGIHMTRNTIVLIDEMDVHLHPLWRHKLLNQLKLMVRLGAASETKEDLGDKPGITVIGTTHSLEIITGFAFEVREPGLRKGGYLIEDDLELLE